MSTEPYPISIATVSHLLELIVNLDEPLPSTLVSIPLLQRHHFLNITINDAAEYLAWPTSLEAATHFLNTFPKAPHSDLSPTVKYSADPETLEAHVSITDTVRLIFHWDQAWKYHNLAFMPFPSNTYEFSDALGIFQSTNDFLQEASYPVSIASGDEDDDSYWNSYGQEDDHDRSVKVPAKPHTPLNSEDAYWARYSSIHGTADSTIPSPLPVKRNLDQHLEGERVFVTSGSLQPNSTELYNPLVPPSPGSLAKRLADLSQRPSSPPMSPIDDDEEASTDSNTTSPTRDAPELEFTGATPVDSPLTAASQNNLAGERNSTTDETDVALRQTIQGLYQLWKADRHRTGLSSDTEAFVALVRSAIEE
ncbi:hypothetical protein CC2G_001113 [Coprinopsis cinerea AmutBmut pab1-1]|nr:hypothetical protein CC2G_001113 [Coprinopsis cinerea AmutBmut pab1-1]